MIARLVEWCTRRHWLVIAVCFVLAGMGELGRRSLSRDALPELSAPQIAVLTDWMGHPASEVSERVTRELTRALAGTPGSSAVRGSSMAGMSYIDVVFEREQDLGAGREAIVARVEKARAKLPATARVEVGPLASSTGWVFQYVLIDRTRRGSLLRMSRLQDTLIRPALLQIPGVVEVAAVGGNVQQALIEVKADQLERRSVAFSDVVASIAPEAFGDADLKRFRFIPVSGAPAVEGSRTVVGDVAHFHFSSDMLSGYADFDGQAAALGAIVIAKRGADLPALIGAIKTTLDGLRDQLTPSNTPHQRATIEIVTAYDRMDMVDGVSQTLLRALSEEVGVVVIVILMFLLHLRSALVPLLTLPFVLLLTFGGMWLFGVPATIMSLGGIGIALGMAVDADVVALEACHRSLEGEKQRLSQQERRQRLAAAAASFSPAIITSLLITALSFLPVFAFTGETGRLLRPLAITKTLVIVAAAAVALSLAPALRERLLSGGVRRELDNPLTRKLVELYRPFVHFALRRPALTLVTAALAVLSAVPVAGRMGAEFLPRIDEGDLLFMPTTRAGVSPGEAAEQLGRQDRAIKQFQEVEAVFGKVGRADTPTDPAPFSMAETTIRLRPRSEWPLVPKRRWYSELAPEWLKPALRPIWPERAPRTTEELVDELDHSTRLPGWTNAWTAPIRARIDMLATGVHTPVGVRVVAPEPRRLERLGAEVEKLVGRVEGARSAVFESVRGEPWPRFELDERAAERHQVEPERVMATANLVLTGAQLGELTWHDDRFRLRVVPGGHGHVNRRNAEPLRELTVRSSGASSQPVPLALLGRPSFAMEPSMLRSEKGELVSYVYVDLESGVDPGRFVDRAARELERAQAESELELGAGERLEWTGQYELLAEGERRLTFIVPLLLLSMFGLLLWLFRSAAEAAIVLLSVPFALVGSFWTLHLFDIPLSAPVWVGLLSTVGLAMQTGVVMVVYIDEAFHRRVREGRIRSRDDIVEAHAEGTVRRLRPKIMTITTMAAGLLPLLWIDGAGSEVIRRIAAPMLGGLVTSAFLTLEVIPVVYTIWRGRQLALAERRKLPLSRIVGPAPGWARHSPLRNR